MRIPFVKCLEQQLAHSQHLINGTIYSAFSQFLRDPPEGGALAVVLVFQGARLKTGLVDFSCSLRFHLCKMG